jgi:hypothetical protein
MIGAPFTGKVHGGHWGDEELKHCIFRLFYILEHNHYTVYSAHMIEKFGEKLRQPTQYLWDDVREAQDVALYIGITDGTQSNGLAVELGVAATNATQILLFVREKSTGISFLEQLVRAHNGVVLRYQSSNDLIEKLRKQLGLEGDGDPGQYYGETALPGG